MRKRGRERKKEKIEGRVVSETVEGKEGDKEGEDGGSGGEITVVHHLTPPVRAWRNKTLPQYVCLSSDWCSLS